LSLVTSAATSLMAAEPQDWSRTAIMPKCECGFDFAKAPLAGRRVESYATIRDRDFEKVIRKEQAVLSEGEPERKAALIADVAKSVGSLMKCPACGTWLFLRPGQVNGGRTLLLKSASPTRRARATRHRSMGVSVTIQLSLVPQHRHLGQMRSAALCLTDKPSSVQVTCPPATPKAVCARFTVPDARQADVVDHIARQFWQVEDYQDCSIGFSRS
jgi:hypothetical protein